MPVPDSMIPVALPMSGPGAVERAAGVLVSHGLVVAPTETRYGLLVRADDDTAVARLFEVKGRIASNPTAFFVGGLDEMSRYGRLTPAARKLAEHFLPGPLTLVLEAIVPWGPPRVVNGRIGFRWSSSPFIQHLVTQVGAPLTATSANRSGQPDLERIEEIQAILGEAVDLYIDGGRLAGPASTVIECVGDNVRILREGAISAQQIEASLGQ